MRFWSDPSIRVVVDSNRLQSDELARFLTTSPSNKAIVTDLTMMEAYKGDTLRSIYKSMSILAQHPTQVVLLKSPTDCMLVKPGFRTQSRLISQPLTASFPEFVRDLARGRAGDPVVEQVLLMRGNTANEKMALLLERSKHLSAHYREMGESLSKEEMRGIYRGSGLAKPIFYKVIKLALEQTASIHISNPGRFPDPLRGRFAADSFAFRRGAVMTAGFLEWVRGGQQMSARPEKLRNDFVDTLFATYGTYFNGLMTADAKLQRLHNQGRAILRILGARLLKPFGELLESSAAG